MSKNKIYGPDIYKRNEHGLLENTEYVFNEDGSVNWRAMIKPEFLYPNKGWFEIRGKQVPSSTEGLDDKQLLIMLGGIKELARLRGFKSVRFDTENNGENYVTAKCQIIWQPNYENPEPVFYEDVANATSANTDSFCIKFLETIACNRAFVRCVRNFLNIHIVGADEIDKSNDGPKTSAEDSFESSIVPVTPSGILEKIAREKLGASSFDEFKDHMRNLWKSGKYKNEEVSNWNSFSDVPAKEARVLISIISKK